LVDLSRYGLSHEPTVAESIADGADLVTFSGDKLLGGPQAGFIVGRRGLVAKINKNPMKRALRVDKIRLAALEATLRLYRDPDRLEQRLPTIRMLARRKDDVAALAQRLLPAVAKAVGPSFTAQVMFCASQIGSGALPVEKIASAGIACRSATGRGSGGAVLALAAAFRNLPVPVIGRIEEQALIFDVRCLEDEDGFTRNLAALTVTGT
jgi:L-seryl-tRNA(Ser) seleniumtransferase